MSATPLPGSRLLPAALQSVGGHLLDDPRRALALAVGLVGLIALADYATGYAALLALLYLLPVFIAAWTAGRLAGASIATLATLSWMVMFHSVNPYSVALYFYWEGAVLFGTLQIFALVIARLRRALERADERFVTVLEELEAAVYVNDMDDGRMLYANRRFRDFFGADAHSANAREFENAFEVVPADFFARAAAAKDGSLALKGEFRDPASDRWFLVHAHSVGWVDGRRVSLKVIADISEAKQAERAGRQQMEKLQLSAKLIAIGEMASSLAHELNQPLTAIASYNQGCVRMLRSGRFDTAELLGFMEKCGAQAVRAGGIINRMREFVRKREPLRSAHDLKAIIAEAVQMIAMEAEKGGVEVVTDFAPSLPPVLVDAIMIEQVLLNLARNSIEAMQQPGGEAKVLRISCAQDSDAMLRVSVRDSGPGIPAPVAANLYTPFFSTKESGMGIGLNISRSIIEFHGGRLWHEPGAERGCVFHFTLPPGPA